MLPPYAAELPYSSPFTSDGSGDLLGLGDAGGVGIWSLVSHAESLVPSGEGVAVCGGDGSDADPRRGSWSGMALNLLR